MKTKFYSLMLMMVAFVTIGSLTSCSKDDDDEVTQGSGAPTADGKKLQFVKIDSSSPFLFEYDSEGRVLKVTSNSKTILFNYSETQVTSTTTYSGSSSAEVVTYMLTNGRITKSIEKASSSSGSDYITEFTYDGNGCLTTIKYTNSSTYDKSTSNSTNRTTYTWKDGNVVNCKKENNYTSVYTYTDYQYVNGSYQNVTNTRTTTETSITETNYTYSNHAYTLPALEADANEILRWQGFYGKNSSNLTSKEQITRTYTSSTKDTGSKETVNPNVSTSSYTIDYSYTFNGSSLEKIFVTTTDNNNKVTVSTIEMSWN